jgi:hypothetical protein
VSILLCLIRLLGFFLASFVEFRGSLSFVNAFVGFSAELFHVVNIQNHRATGSKQNFSMEILVSVSFALISKYPEATWEHESKNIHLEANSEE